MSISDKINIDEEYEQSRWALWDELDNIAYKGSDVKLKKFLDLFTFEDFLKMPIIATLVSHKRIRILKFLHKKGVPFINTDEDDLLAVACGAGGSMECVKFLVEKVHLTDIHKELPPYDETPYTLAVSYNHKEIINYLEKKFNIQYIKVKHLKIILETNKALSRRVLFREEYFNRNLPVPVDIK